MRILHIAPYSDLSKGGPVIAVRNMVLATLAENTRAQVCVATIFDKSQTASNCGFKDIEEVSNVLRFESSFSARLSYSAKMHRWLRQHLGNFDVVHMHVPLAFCNISAGLLCEQKQIPYVVSTHGCLDTWSMRNKAIKKHAFMMLFGNRLMQRASSIHVTSEFEDKNLISFGSSQPRNVIPLPVWFSGGDERTTPRKNDKYALISVARIDRVKNFEFLLHALQALKDRGVQFEFKIVGDGDIGYRNELRQLVSQLGLDRQVIWLGHKKPAEVRKLLNASSCFLLASRHENFGLSAVEALSLGVPAILSDQVAIASEMDSCGAGYMVPLNEPGLFADAIEAAHQPENRFSLSNQAIKFVRDKYSLAACGRELCNMYGSSI